MHMELNFSFSCGDVLVLERGLVSFHLAVLFEPASPLLSGNRAIVEFVLNLLSCSILMAICTSILGFCLSFTTLISQGCPEIAE